MNPRTHDLFPAELAAAQAIAEADLDVSDEDMLDESQLDAERAYQSAQSEYDHNARR